MLKDRYVWLSFLSTLLLCVLFMGKLFIAPDNYLFSKGGDGFQTYYQSIYHVKYDTTCGHQQSMNYPYGESIFFTGGQPLLSNAVKTIKPIVDLSDHMVGITNLMMLLGILICPIFLYLIFKEFILPRVYAFLFAVGLTFLTQQWERMGGHYSLAYLYAIPGMIYFLIRFYESGKWKWSFVIASYMLFLMFAHLYYFVFCAAIMVGFWISCVVFRKEKKITFLKSILHGGVQLILPFLVFQFAASMSSDVTDRTSVPWGFMVFRSNWSGYFFPYGMWYENLMSAFRPKNTIEWEGMAYVGATAVLLLVGDAFFMLVKFKTFVSAIAKEERRFLMGLCIACVLCIMISFAFPFNYGFENVLSKLGPLQQFRGIGRFAFVAFFPINILLIVLFFKIPFRKMWLRNGMAVVLIVLMGSEGYSRIHRQSEYISNERAERLHTSPNAISSKLNPALYQAILPLPFFHVGSENVWMDGKQGMNNDVYDLSLRTGLPTFGAFMSRTSVSQTYRVIALSQELMEWPPVLQDLKDQRPLLVMCDTAAMPEHQLALLTFGQFLFSEQAYSYYALPIDAFEQKLNQNHLQQTELAEWCLYPDSSVRALTRANPFLHLDEEKKFTMNDQWQRYYEDSIPSELRGKQVLVSFWVKDFTRDLVARTTLEIVEKKGDEVVHYETEIFGKRLVGLFGKDALVEYSIPVKENAEFITLSIQNKLIQGRLLESYLLLIRPEQRNCCILRNGKTYINNRINS